MPEIDYTSWRFWLDVIRLAGTIALWVYVYLVTRRKAVEARFEKIEESITRELRMHRREIDDRCRRRMTRIEGLEGNDQQVRVKMGQMPNQRDIKDMSRRLDMIQSTMSEMGGRLEGINRAVDLINEFLINQGGRGTTS